ncbi:hypothetical protein LR48_Vigan10g009700 [Vigna angularis]|uniref:Uncharacterized protein n=1 Tax=Phaseolus angularis TaxID=3914 RepID=A0A0L9VGK8_PHAAN|nr:hypothetical protein LR48_Vigan10g009700 [Vigna angularis]
MRKNVKLTTPGRTAHQGARQDSKNSHSAPPLLTAVQFRLPSRLPLVKVRHRRRFATVEGSPPSKVHRRRRFTVVEGSPPLKVRRRRRLTTVEGFAALCRRRTVEGSTTIVEHF